MFNNVVKDERKEMYSSSNQICLVCRTNKDLIVEQIQQTERGGAVSCLFVQLANSVNLLERPAGPELRAEQRMSDEN